MDALIRVCILLLAAVPSFAAGTPQLVWFAPQAPGTWPNGRTGPVDYMDLFTPAAPWAVAASHIQVFDFPDSLFDGDLPGQLTDAQWQQAFADLARRGIALAVQWGPLSPGANGCGNSVEGFQGPNALKMAQHIKRLGGTLQYLELDEPFYFANIYSGAFACQWTTQQIAANAAQNIALVRTVFPNVIVGEAEPIAPSPDWLQTYAAWFDAFQAATGAPLAFFHCDADPYGDENWIRDVNSIRPVLAARGIAFGMYYDDLRGETPGSTTDAAWMQAAESHFLDYELHGGVIPDQLVFGSWLTYPTHLLPETDPDAMTYLVDLYFRQRTSLSLTSAANQASGKLQDSQGNPIPAAPVAITLQPVSGPGIISTYTLTGTVPAAATNVTQAHMQICVNECGSQGPNDMNVYAYQYADSGTTVAQDFSKGLSGWAVEPSSVGSTAAVQLASDSTGPSLLIQATAAQQTYVISSSIPVTPGSAFTLTVKARIAPASVGSGYFALIFLIGGKESSVAPRVTIPFTPGTSNLASAATANDGSYSVAFPPQSVVGVFQLQASYPGSDKLWPAFATAPLDYTPAIQSNGIVNAADFQAEPLSPDAWFTIFGQNLGAAGTWSSPSTTVVGGASVSVCGLPADVSFNSGPLATRWQLNALVPVGVTGQTSCPVVVTVDGLATQPATVAIKAGVMELFGFTASAGPLPIVTHADYNLVGPASAGLVPARPGETVIAWGTGDCTMPTVTVAGAIAPVSFAGRTGPGLCQINFVVPNGPTGSNQLKLSTSLNLYNLWVSP